jgi:heptosyltransferase-2
VVAPSWIGDALLAQPLLARIHALHPGITLDALAVPWTAAVLARMPEIARVIPSPFAHGDLKLRERFRLGRSLAAERYDAAWVLPNTLKSALVPFFAGIRRRIGYTGESRYVVVNVRHVLEPLAVPLMAERYAQLAELPGAPVHRPLAAPRLRVDEANRNRALAELGLNLDRPVVVFCPGAEYGPAKRWPTRHFATLALMLARKGYQIWLLGSQKDRAVATEVMTLAPGACQNLAGRTDLATAIDLMSAADHVVTNDSGLMHVAAAVGRSIVALYGSSSPDHTPPLGGAAAIVRIPLECSPCYARECPLGHFRCMNELLPQQVFEALRATRDGRDRTARH